MMAVYIRGMYSFHRRERCSASPPGGKSAATQDIVLNLSVLRGILCLNMSSDGPTLFMTNGEDIDNLDISQALDHAGLQTKQ